MKRLFLGLGLAFLIGIPLFLASGISDAASDKEAVCKEAEERYQEMFGKPSSAEPHTVILMYEYTFCPTDIEVKQGTKVRWVNVDKRTSHSVWFKEAGEKESDRAFPEEHVEKTVELAPGIYAYICGPHWEKRDMVAKLKVVP